MWTLPGGVIFVLLLFLVYLSYKFVYLPLQLFRNNGINGPSPLPLVGNFLLRHRMGFFKFHDYLFKNYGSVVGYYNGHMPMLAVTDVDMLKQILVKEFDAFMDRPYIPDFTREATAPQGLLISQGQKWKTARQTLSPSFSIAKMKAMMPLIEKSASVLVECIGKSANSTDSVDVCQLYGRFTMETILATAFGRTVNVQRGESDQIVEAAYYIFRLSEEGSSFSIAVLLPLLSIFPWIESVIRLIFSRSLIAKYSQMMYCVSKEIVKERRKNPNPRKYKDLLQLMIDANPKAVNPSTSNEQPEDDGQRLTDDQIVAHSVTFLLAGYETTSTALAYVSYMLALNPSVQEKLQNDIDCFFTDNPESSLYDAVQEIDYLDKVVLETLRLHSPAGSIIRQCQKSVVVNGVTIPKGIVVDVPIHLLHKNPKHWKDPELFDPERFSPEEKAKRPQLSYVPFGFGPRNCIGMRFALLEAKVALLQLLRKYTFVRAPDTEVPLETNFGITVAPKHGVYLKIAARSNK